MISRLHSHAFTANLHCMKMWKIRQRQERDYHETTTGFGEAERGDKD